MLIPISVRVEPNQEKRILGALRKKRGCHIGVRKGGSGGNDVLLVNDRHRLKLGKASHGSKVNLPFRHDELVHNMRHKGGFLPLIAAALAPIIGGIAGGFIEKEIAGSGLGRFSKGKPWWHGGGTHTPHRPQLYTLQSSGSGLRLNPWVGH